MSAIQGRVLALLFFSGMLLAAGCSNSSGTADQANRTEANSSEPDRPGELPLAIGQNSGEDDTDEEEEIVTVQEPEEGTPEWHIREILKIRLMPYPVENEESAEKTAVENVSADDQKPLNDLEKQTKLRRERNLQVIELAKQAIAQTHQNAEKELVFNSAVHHLLDARLQLALAGEQEDVDALYGVADALQTTKPNSEAAAEAVLTVVNFAHANAVRYAETEPQWIQEFARQAQVFGTRTADRLAELSPDELASETSAPARQLRRDAARAAQLLMAAGQSCDMAHFPSEAKSCYLLLSSRFPESAPAQQAAGIVRRLQLQGQSLQLAGPTVDGNYISVEDYRGKTLVIVFWSSQAKPFTDGLPALTKLLTRAQNVVSVVGVNLDTEELPLDQFLEEHNLSWPQIFFSEPEKRGWNSPLATFYGIMSLPTIWIVDPQGVVAETDVTMENIEAKLVDVVRRNRKSGAAGAPKEAAANKKTIND